MRVSQRRTVEYRSRSDGSIPRRDETIKSFSPGPGVSIFPYRSPMAAIVPVCDGAALTMATSRSPIQNLVQTWISAGRERGDTMKKRELYSPESAPALEHRIETVRQRNNERYCVLFFFTQ
jgi:hypothetical protein